jgi:hypothetical protein
MDRKMLDRTLPLVYAALIAASVFLFSHALVGIAVLGGLALALYYSAIRPRLVAGEQTIVDGPGDRQRNRDA